MNTLTTPHAVTDLSGRALYPMSASNRHDVTVARLVRDNQDLLRELEFAHRIIRNALNCMDVGTQAELARINIAQGIDLYGATRFTERDAVIRRVKGGV